MCLDRHFIKRSVLPGIINKISLKSILMDALLKNHFSKHYQ